MDDELPPDPFPGDPFADKSGKPTPKPEGGLGDGGSGDGGFGIPGSAGEEGGTGGLDALGGLGGLFGANGLGGLGGLFAANGLGGLGGTTSAGPAKLQWDSARQAAIWTAAGGTVEANLDPMERIGFQTLLNKVRQETISTLGLPADSVPSTIEAQTRAGFAAQYMARLRNVLDEVVKGIATPASLKGQSNDIDAKIDDEPHELAAIGQMFAMLGPAMNSPQLGTMIGTFATIALGTAEIAAGGPSGKPNDQLTNSVMVIPANVAAFADEWSIDPVMAKNHVVIVEAVTAGVLRVPHIQARMVDLVHQYAGATRPNPSALRDQIDGMLGSLGGSGSSGDGGPNDSPLGGLSALFSGFGLGGLGDISAFSSEGSSANGEDAMKVVRSVSGDRGLIGVAETPQQARIRSQMRTLLVPIAGVIEFGVAVIGARMLGDNRQVMEAWRRRRGAPTDAVKSLATLFGVLLNTADLDAASSFVGGVLQRVGSDGLSALWTSAENLPTAAEVEAPGLWLARIGLTD